MYGKVKYMFVRWQLSIRISHQIGQKARNSKGFSVPGRENGYCSDACQTLIFNDIYLIFLNFFLNGVYQFDVWNADSLIVKESSVIISDTLAKILKCK